MKSASKMSCARQVALALGALSLGALSGGQANADQVIPDDLIVQGSTCMGLDCVNNEAFGFGTLRLKENNTRIDFIDTSTSAGFSTRDWRLEANSSANPGTSHFAIKDMGEDASTGAEGGTALLMLSAGALANSIFVGSNSKVGFRNANPLLDLHMTTADTPAVRFEQTNASGFTAQTWDIGANEANFFVRDVTGGSRLPFRIRPGAPTSSIDIAATGFVGIGTTSPAANLHVSSTTTPKIALESKAAHPSNWQFATAASNGVFSIADLTNTTAPFRINQGAPTDSIRIAGNGNIVLGKLTHCFNGIRSSATGALSCMPSLGQSQGVANADNLSLVTLASTRGAGGGASHGEQSTGAGASAAKSEEAETAATCSEADLTGSWGMVGNTGEGSSSAVMWCDVQLSKAAKAYSIMGKCRSHSVTKDAPASYELRGERSISVTSACKLSGSFKLVGANETVTASIVEGRVQGVGKSRAVGVSRWQSGKTATLQTFVMQR